MLYSDADLLGVSAESLYLDEILNSDQDLALITGSRVEGFGNPRSDIDVYVVFADESKVFSGARIRPVGDYSIDYEAYSWPSLRALADKLNTLDEIGNRRQIALSSLDDIDTYYRICVAAPVYNKDAFRELRRFFDVSVVERLLSSYAWYRYGTHVAMGQRHLTQGATESASFAFREALMWALDAHLAENHEAYPNLKWRFEKLQRLYGTDSEVYTTAWNLKALGGITHLEYCRLTQEFCWALGAIEGDVVDLSTRVPFLPQSSEEFVITGTTYVVRNKALIYQLDAVEEIVWSKIDNIRTVGEIINESLQQFASNYRAEQVEAALRRLVDVGLVFEA